MFQSDKSGRSKWIINFGCTQHASWKPEYFKTYGELEDKFMFKLGDSRKISAKGISNIRFCLNLNGKEHYFL